MITWFQVGFSHKGELPMETKQAARKAGNLRDLFMGWQAANE